MKPGDLIFVYGSSWIGEEIELITKSIYDHTAGLVKENELIEANGFRKTGYQALDFYTKRADIYTCDLLTDEQREKIVSYVTNEVGGRYDYFLILWELSRYILHVTWPYHEWHARICSTLWNAAYSSAGIELCPGIRYPTPGELAKSKWLRKIASI